MRRKPYYSVRTGKNALTKSFDLESLKELFKVVFVYFEERGYFQESFGYYCVDAGNVPGKLGQNLAGALLLELRKKDLTPIHEKIGSYSEDDLFDIVEFLYEHCSKPIEEEGRYHSFSNCGWHYSTFKKEPGQAEYRERMNKILCLYEGGYELSIEGEILTLAEDGLDGLFEAPLPTVDPENIDSRVAAARTKFRRHRASLDERRDAIRDLADVLEYLRPRLKPVLVAKDESDLFEIANNFGIRHHNAKQKNNYDKPIWYSWMFYYYLATIHAAVRLIKQREGKN